ncbi:L,D-transpeptidase-like protein [Amycolatopsis cihanbeyliensis]|uniref:L,D-transpeptidase-like protein n=1 Tax=Amycolatopsis cihanbeyliensis TaxID=1128664 RepID=A0A542DJZ4_AMYCI|nr:L,D-transpeptidase-like protein [Amycolatopsis cihanbeyliensis]
MERPDEFQNHPIGGIRHPRRGSLPKRLLAVGAIALLTLLASACGGEEVPGAPQALSPEEIAALPEATTYGKVPNAPEDPEPNAAVAGEVIHPEDELVVYAGAGGDPIARLPVKQVESPTWVPVIERQGDWAQILLPSRPNTSAGWVHVPEGSVESANNDYIVHVDLAAYQLRITKDDEQMGEWTVGIGKPEYPTPKGRAFIIASIAETENTYSPIVLPLSSHSESHETFGGGPGTVGIHTWPDDSFVGKANSDGCIRVPKEALDKLVELPLGTIVSIA